MKAVLALIAVAIAAVSANVPAGPVGTCPEVDGEYPVYLMDLKNRNVYYECSNGKPRLEPCSGDLVFNPSKNICDFASSTCEPFGAVGECPAEDGDFRVYLRDGFNVATFYMCENGEANMLNCDDGLVYDPYREACFVQE